MEIKQTTVETYWANIYVGLKAGYGNLTYDFEFAKNLIAGYANETRTCVTVTQTNFVYVGGYEQGIIVGLVNYPRFPSTPKEIEDRAFALALFLKIHLQQERLSIVFPTKTIMLGEI